MYQNAFTAAFTYFFTYEKKSRYFSVNSVFSIAMNTEIPKKSIFVYTGMPEYRKLEADVKHF